MGKFQNYRTVEIADGVTAKVAPLRIDLDDCQRTFAAISDLAEGNIAGFSRSMPHVTSAIRVSLSENHTPKEVEEIVSALRFSQSAGTPFMGVLYALMGREPSESSAADDDDK